LEIEAPSKSCGTLINKKQQSPEKRPEQFLNVFDEETFLEINAPLEGAAEPK